MYTRAKNNHEEIQELKDIGELLENGHAGNVITGSESPPVLIETNHNRDTEPFKLEEIKDDDIKIELSEAVLREPQPAMGKIPAAVKTVKPSNEIKELEEIKKSLQREEKIDKSKKAPIITKGLDLFDRLKDKTRVTIIKEVPFKNKVAAGQFLIDIKDKDSNLLESIKVDITPEIKKVTLIIDVKK